MKDKVLDSMQVFSRAIIIPIFFLPIAGIILALSSLLSNPSIVGEGSSLINVGKYIASALWPILNNLGIIFCVSISFGIAKEKKHEAALVGLISYLTFLGANNQWLTITKRLVPYKTADNLYGTGQTLALGFQVIDMGVFLGIILGIIVALVFNKYCNKELPSAINVYGNTKLVYIIMIPIILVLSIVLSYVWPFVAAGINALAYFINIAGPIGVFLYNFLNRFLIPTGLHHLIWTPFLYSNLGGELTLNGHNYFGAFNIFIAQLADPSVKVLDPSAKYLQYGMTKMYGLVGAAIAFYHTAKPENKGKLRALLIPAAATSVLVGVTEPIEFTFLFLAPVLWLVHSLLDGVFGVITVYLGGVRTFGSSGLIDFIAYNIPAGIGKTRWPIYVAIGLVQLAVYYFLFKFLIVKLNLKTPGREDSSEEVKLYTKADYKNKKNKGTDNVLGEVIVNALGGKENIETVDNCYSRLRIKVTDPEVVDENTLKSTGANGVIKNGENIQVIYGPKVNGVRHEVDKYLAEVEIKKDDKNVNDIKSEVSNEFLVPVSGKIIDLDDVSDEVFSQRMMGNGFAIEPKDGYVFSPVDGTITSIFPTKHAISIKSNSGVEILIHFGLDTVGLKGEGFKLCTEEGAVVKAGDLILEVNIDYVKEKATSIVVPVIFLEMNERTFTFKTGDAKAKDKGVIQIS
jgi:PTS system arbutin-like IIC component